MHRLYGLSLSAVTVGEATGVGIHEEVVPAVIVPRLLYKHCDPRSDCSDLVSQCLPINYQFRTIQLKIKSFFSNGIKNLTSSDLCLFWGL